MNGSHVPGVLNVVRLVAILFGTVLALWVSIGVSLNFAFGERYPDLANEWWPAGVMPRVASAGNTLNAPPVQSAELAQMHKSLRDAALREPVNSYALGMLGAVADYRHDTSHARKLFRLSEAMSRRNLLSQMWLVEDAVNRDDVHEVILHYDRAMRVSKESRQTLIPILVEAIAEPAILENLLPVLAERPSWSDEFAFMMSAKGNDPQAMSAVVAALKPDLSRPGERRLVESILLRMVALNAEREAINTVNRLEGRAGSTRTMQGGDFEEVTGTLPFAWSLRKDENIHAFRSSVPTGGFGLWIETQEDMAGVAATQLVGLAAGRHALTGTAGRVPANIAGRPAIGILCEHGKVLGRFVLPPAGENGRSFRFEFDVPAQDCVTQWVKLEAAPEGDTNTWFDKLAIVQ
ncbi:hypothetical protein [Novosphingobium album (ex Hu et al. 2023)]|uniref:HEAT repeat domain-containing protein n=1 Tax=Novosphingobium album (ex Hu et al. 2023) TaxID=2930093 RepID=A0ABT0B611_9SPHN|nr:hypothetical protein [Novosphingobium album (ex Hu et al. 2023)]MCJ2180443.1 hypothetical protein [Novosphingobium album (ex Hu et al. 2023)]